MTALSLPELRTTLASDFRLFLDWELQHETPKLPFAAQQYQMAKALQSGAERVAVFAARGFAKSYTCIVEYAAWRLLRNPSLKILFLSGSVNRADLNAKALRTIIDESSLFKHVRPHRSAPRTQFNLANVPVSPNSFSVDAASIDTKRTGIHVDLILCDDIEQDDDIGSLARREHLLERVQEIEAWLNEPSLNAVYNGNVPVPEKTSVVVVGTFNCGRDSIYLPPEDGSGHWLDGAEKLVIPALNEQGESNFPTIRSTEALVQKQQTLRKDYWLNQFQMDPNALDGELCPFDVGLIEKHSEQCVDVPLVAVVDPSEGGDYFAVALMGHSRGSLYVDEVLGWQNKTSDESFSLLVDELTKRGIRKMHVETNSNNPDKPDALANIAKRIVREKNAKLLVQWHKSTRNKKDKVLDLEPAFHTGALKLGPKALSHEQFMREIRGTRFNGLPKPFDDHVDAVATGLVLFADKIRKPLNDKDRPTGLTPFRIH